jgi:ATP-dependent DNA helicase DinG
MRQEDDHGVIVVCDERIAKQRYGQKFLKSLPPNIPVLKSLDEIPTFLSSFD